MATRRKELTENNGSKILSGALVENQLVENSPTGKSSPNIELFYEVLIYYEVLLH